jgi:saccharopine dehydrogenase (NAD+, L-lysine-forming)
MNKIKVGILRETKTPPDRRVALPPNQAVELLDKFPNVQLFIQPSDLRAFSDDEYLNLGLNVQEDLSHCDILIGVKEVKIPTLIPGKTYLYFSHTAKKQPHNGALLQATLKNKIRLVDYEYLTDKQGIRLIAFGRWAGVVGAYNAILAIGKATENYKLRRAYECLDMGEFFKELHLVKLPNYKILITGGGRVANGAIEVLDYLKIKKVIPEEFLQNNFDYPVYTQLDPWHYVKRKDREKFEWVHFSKYPETYESIFLPYTKVTDVLITCHFWDPNSPVFMTKEEMQAPNFRIKIIADISCDLDGPIPTSRRISTIEDPFFGFNLNEWKEADAYNPKNITIMTIDNLPGEAPRDASTDFATKLIEKIFPSLFGVDFEGIINRASITTSEGKLSERFSYLQDYVDGK